jgi:hypothetical protein
MSKKYTNYLFVVSTICELRSTLRWEERIAYIWSIFGSDWSEANDRWIVSPWDIDWVCVFDFDC